MQFQTVRVEELKLYEPLQESPEVQFLTELREKGYKVPSVLLDGDIHRFATSDKAEDDSGWYVGFTEPIPAGAYGNWRTGEKVVWTARGRNLSSFDMMAVQTKIEALKKKAEEDRKRRADSAALKAQALWEMSSPCIDADHGYLKKKQLSSAHGAQLDHQGNLLVPIYQATKDGMILGSIETIDHEGHKRFLPGGAVKGGFFVIGTGKPCFVAEGYATGASIYEATGRGCIVAFSAGNLASAIAAYRSVDPACGSLTIVADNDDSGTGEREAYKAKEATGCEVVLIPEKGMDANDYASAGRDLRGLLGVGKAYLIPAEDCLATPVPQHWLIKHWIPRGSTLMMIFGQSGNGKTFLALDMMLSIATGRSLWNGQKVRAGNVVYLCGEGQRGVRERVAAWAQNQGVTSFGGHMLISQGASTLDTPDGYAKVVSAIEESGRKPDLIMVDTLNRFMAGDENDTRDASAFVAVCARLQEQYDACVCLIHHTGVGVGAQKRARGSSAFLGALDVQVYVARKGDIYSATMTKCKDGKEQMPVNFKLREVPISGWLDEDGQLVSSAVVDPTDEVPQSAPVSAQQKRDEDILLDASDAIGTVPAAGGVFIGREAWIDFLVKNGRDRKAAQRDLSEGQERKLVSRLISYGDLVPAEGGWTISGQIASVAGMAACGKIFREE